MEAHRLTKCTDMPSHHMQENARIDANNEAHLHRGWVDVNPFQEQ